MWFIGNWKMNGDNILFFKFQNIAWPTDHHICLCVPHAYLGKFTGRSLLILGAQNCHHEPYGAYTGEVSAAMLSDMQVRVVLVGHSERRKYFGETAEMIKGKILQAVKHNILPILCAGEPYEVRNEGKAIEFVINQIRECLPEKVKVLIAYEPIWAIGTGQVASTADIQEMHTAIKENFGMEVIYGGSVTPSNAKEILRLSAVDGALVGGASLNLDSFKDIILASKYGA